MSPGNYLWLWRVSQPAPKSMVSVSNTIFANSDLDNAVPQLHNTHFLTCGHYPHWFEHACSVICLGSGMSPLFPWANYHYHNAPQIEREMGSAGFLLTYFAAGIFGNILGGNFALVGLSSTGASGAIFGTVAVRFNGCDPVHTDASHVSHR